MLIEEKLVEQLNKDGFVVSGFKGSSMYPFLKQNKNKILIERTNKNNINKYDVVLYKYNNKYILHRIINIKDNICVIRGDNTIVKEYISINNIIAKLKGYYSKDKYIEVNIELNKKYYYLSLITYPLRYIKYKIGKIIHG